MRITPALADLVVAAHLAYLGYVVLGGLLALRDLRWLWPHAATLVWGVAGLVVGLPCPLTSLEKWLLEAGGETPYAGPFISHYLAGTLYPHGAGPVVLAVVAAVVLSSYVVALRPAARSAV